MNGSPAGRSQSKNAQPTGTNEYLEADLYRSRRRAKVKLTPLQTLGQRIFYTVFALAVIMLCALTVWAFLTYPSVGDVKSLAPKGRAVDRLQLWREAKAEWVQQTTSVAQMALFGSVIPLLGTIAGYLLGERASSDQGNDDAELV